MSWSQAALALGLVVLALVIGMCIYEHRAKQPRLKRRRW